MKYFFNSGRMLDGRVIFIKGSWDMLNRKDIRNKYSSCPQTHYSLTLTLFTSLSLLLESGCKTLFIWYIHVNIPQQDIKTNIILIVYQMEK